jgi:hypothetical protein
MVYGGINAADAWDLIPADLRRKFDRVASGMQRVMTQRGDGADQVGLIHADLHLDNALFRRDDVRIIDFDDCGFGYWLYDIAVPLWELRHRGDYEQFRAALVEGYTSIGDCRPEALPISMTSSLPARSRSGCGTPAPRRSTPRSRPTFPRFSVTSATRWTPSETRRQAALPRQPA